MRAIITKGLSVCCHFKVKKYANYADKRSVQQDIVSVLFSRLKNKRTFQR